MSYPMPGGALQVLERLNKAGFEAYLVGGCVRDLLRGVEPQDWDICTSARPEEIKTCFASERLIETGVKHGTVTLVLGGGTYEVTTYRSDGAYSDGRHPDSVRFVPCLTEDLARRDFTVNAIAMDADGRIADPFDGAKDLAQSLLRCVGDPDRRFQEDGLRLMRCLRFSACLGYTIQAKTAAALRRNVAMLDKVAPERVQAELCKLLMGEGAVAVLRTYPEVFCRFWPDLAPLVALEQNNPWHCYGGWEHTLHALAAAPADLVTRLAVLLHDVGKPACKTTDPSGIDHFYGHPAAGVELSDAMLRALKFDNHTRQSVLTLVEHHDAPIQESERSVRRWLGRLGPETFFRLMDLKRCDSLGQGHAQVPQRLAAVENLKRMAREVIAQGQCFLLKDLAVNGTDVIAAGVAPGPQVGAVLDRLLDQVVSGRLPNDRQALLAALGQSPGGEIPKDTRL